MPERFKVTKSSETSNLYKYPVSHNEESEDNLEHHPAEKLLSKSNDISLINSTDQGK